MEGVIGSTIGVFGANGYIGRHLVRRLLLDGRRVVAFGRAFPATYAEEIGGAIETRVIDFTDTLSTHAALQDIDQVVQLVNSSSPAIGNGRVMADLSANVLPHVAFIESCLLSGVSRLVFVSSGGTVYGEPRYLPIDEQHPVQPIVSYGLTKLVVEQYIRMLGRDTAMSHCILRVSNPYGPGQTLRKGQGLIASILQRHAQGLPITVFGDGLSQRDYLFIDDLSDALVAALDGPPMRETMNVGTGVGRSILDIIAALEAALATPLSIEFVESRHTDATSNILNCLRIRDILGWEPRISFNEGIRRTVDAMAMGPVN